MAEPGSILPWTDEQWARVQRTAADAARRARVASTVLPLVGPLPEDQASVSKLTLDEGGAVLEPYYAVGTKRLSVDDGQTVKLATLSCEVYVRTAQAQDPDLAAVRQMVARAAVTLGRLEDAIVMRGQPGPDEAPVQLAGESAPGSLVVAPEIYRVQGGEEVPGLRDVAMMNPPVPLGPDAITPVQAGDGEGEALVKAVADVIQLLEARGQYGPFAAMFGQQLYQAAYNPSPSLVLPADRFVPFLAGGSLHRSTVLPADEGVIVATGDAPVDLVIASDIHVSFVQRTPEPRYVLRVSERMVLRPKQFGAVSLLRMQPTPIPAPVAPPQPPPDDNGSA